MAFEGRIASYCPRCLAPLLAALFMSLPVGAWAVIGTNDLVPAATLLVPYFEVDLEDSNGSSTIVTVRNVTPVPVVAHGVVWTDLGVPTVTFDMVMSGFSTRTIDLRELFENGTIGFPAFGGDCEDLGEFGVAARFLPGLQRAHRGLSSSLFDNDCAAIDRGDRIARGFVTFDSTNDCTTLTPVDDGYFEDEGIGVANDFNALWGEYAIVDERRSRAVGEPMVHIEATDDPDPVFGARSFYFRSSRSGGDDHREPLAQSWGIRHFHELTDVICWRDEIQRFPFPCEQSPRAQTQGDVVRVDDVITTVYDHESNSDTTDDSPVPCNGASSRTTVGGDTFPAFPKTGWIRIDTDDDFPVAQTQGFRISQQGYVAAFHRNHPAGRSIATGGVALDPVLPIGEQ